MTDESSKAKLVRRFHRALGEGDRDTVLSLTASELTVHAAEVEEEAGGNIVTNEAFWDGFYEFWIKPWSDISETLDHLIIDDDMVGYRFTWSAVHDGGDLLGIPPTGTEVSISGNTHLRVEDGQIVEFWGKPDIFPILQSLDILPETFFEMRIDREIFRVLLRVLRHNIRNDLTVISGYAELISADDASTKEYSEFIIEKTSELRETAEKIRRIEQIVLDIEGTEAVSLTSVLSNVVEEQRNAHDGVIIGFEDPDEDFVIDSDQSLLTMLFEEAIDNAIRHSDRKQPQVNVSVLPNRADDFAATIIIADDGPGIPDHELTPIERGREEPLEHGSGIGLWAMKWGIEQLGGEISFEANDPRGTQVQFHIGEYSRIKTADS